MTRHRISLLAVAALAGLVWAAGCGDGATEPPAPSPDPTRPTTVAVSPSTAELTAVGATVQLTVEVRDQNGNALAGATVTWASSAPAVATVSSAGLVTAAGNGTATITATAGPASGTATVTVAQEVSAVAVSPAADTLVAGDTLRLSAVAADANGHPVAEAGLSWASSDTLVAAVDDAGLVTGVGAGEAEVTATAAGVAGRAELVVMAPVPATVSVTPDTVSLTALGQTAQLAAEVRDQIGRVMDDVQVSWSSAETAVAAVDSAGLVTAAGNGSVTMTATAGSASGSAVVTVAQVVSAVTVSPSADTLVVGETLRLSALAADANGHPVADTEFSWSSSDKLVVVVDDAGLVTGVGAGQADVTVTSAEIASRAALTVTINEPLIYKDNVFVLPVEEYLATRDLPYDAYAKRVYEHFADAFDFLVFVHNLTYREGTQGTGTQGFLSGVSNDVSGIGLRSFSRADRFGSAGRLQSVVVLPFYTAVRRGPMLHEIMHRWGNYILTTGQQSGSHWGFSSADGELGGFDIADLVDLGGGRYTAGNGNYSMGSFSPVGRSGNMDPYSPIELYLAGMISPEGVPNLWVAEDGAALLDENGVVTTVNGEPIFTASTIKTYTIEDIIAEHGPRVPAATGAQHSFRAIVILLVNDRQHALHEILETVSADVAWFSNPAEDEDERYNFFEATGGRAEMRMDGLSEVIRTP